jgi:hypothetical protein
MKGSFQHHILYPYHGGTTEQVSSTTCLTHHMYIYILIYMILGLQLGSLVDVDSRYLPPHGTQVLEVCVDSIWRAKWPMKGHLIIVLRPCWPKWGTSACLSLYESVWSNFTYRNTLLIHFNSEDGSSMYLRSVGNASHIHTVQDPRPEPVSADSVKWAMFSLISLYWKNETRLMRSPCCLCVPPPSVLGVYVVGVGS